MGLPKNTLNDALMLKAGVDSSVQLAEKSAVSLYIQINPDSPTTQLLAKNYIE